MKTETNLDDVLERLGFKLISELELCDLDELICNISELNHDNTPFIVLLEDNRHLVYESTKEFYSVSAYNSFNKRISKILKKYDVIREYINL
jgi:hypothetical protein